MWSLEVVEQKCVEVKSFRRKLPQIRNINVPFATEIPFMAEEDVVLRQPQQVTGTSQQRQPYDGNTETSVTPEDHDHNP